MYHEALCNAPNSGIDGALRYLPYEYGAIYFQLAGRRREVSGRRSGQMVCAYAVVFRHSQRLPCFPPLSPRSYKDPRFDSALTWGGLFTAEDERIRQHKVRSPCISLYPSQSARYCPVQSITCFSPVVIDGWGCFHSRGASFSLSYHSFSTLFPFPSVRTPQRAVRRRCETWYVRS